MPIITWVCENCNKRLEGGLRPPRGWVEVSFWDGQRQKFHRYSFCSYACASAWAGKRYDEQPKEANHAQA